jgi:hypothetical protein
VLLLGAFAAFSQILPPSQLRSLSLDATAKLNLDLSNHMQYKGNVLAYATADSVHLLNAPVACPASLCAECILFTTRLLSIAIPGGRLAAPPALALVSGGPETGNANPTRAIFAVLPPRGKLHLYTAKSGGESGGWTLTHDSVAFDAKANQQARLLDFQVVTQFSDPFGTSAFPDSFFTVAGTQGLLSHVQWKNGAPGEVVNRTIPGDDITAIGPGLLGGASGWIYGLGTDTGPARLAHPFPAAIRSLDETGALGDSGWVAVKEDSGWSGYKVSGSGSRGFRIGYEAAGLAIDLWGRSGDPTHQVLRDAPTTFAATSDQGPLRREPNGGTNSNRPEMAPWTIAVHLSDAEGNFRIPAIDLIQAQSDTAHLTGGTFQRTNPKGGCESPGICVQAKTPDIGLILKRDSVVMEMRVQASFQPMCGKLWAERTDSLLRIARAWRVGDILHVGGAGAGYGFSFFQGDALNGPILGRGGIRYPSVVDRSRGIAVWPAGMHPDPSARALVYGADGMRKGDFAPGESLLHFESGLVFVVWPENKGNSSASRILLR